MRNIVTICLIVALFGGGCDKPLPKAEVTNSSDNAINSFGAKNTKKSRGFNREGERDKKSFEWFVEAKEKDRKRHPLLSEQLTIFAEMGKEGREHGQRLFGSEPARITHIVQFQNDGRYSIIKVPFGHHCKWCKQASNGGFYYPPD